MSGDTLDGFGDLNEAMTEFKATQEGLANSFAVALLPMMTALFSAISAIPTPVLQLVITLTGTIATVVAVMKAVDSTIGTFGKFGEMLGGIDAKTLKTTGIILGVVAVLIALAAIIAVIIGKGDDLGRTMDSVSSSVGNISAAAQGARTKYHAKGTEYFEGGKTWVGEEGPELVSLPRGSRIYNSKQSKSMSGDTYYITVNAKADDITSIQKLINIAKQEQTALRVGTVKL